MRRDFIKGGILNSVASSSILLIMIGSSTLFACTPCSLPPSRVVVCGIDDQGAVLLDAEVIIQGDDIAIGEFSEFVTLPVGAGCPHQWRPATYDPRNGRVSVGKIGWFVVGADKGGLGGRVFRLDWQDAQIEEWFQLPRGDMVLDVVWSEARGWQALAVGGNPDCGDIPLGNESSRVRCAQASGALYLVNDSGDYQQLQEANGIGRCYGVLSSEANAVAFVESEECFAHDSVTSQSVLMDLDDGQPWVLSGGGKGGKPHWSPDGKMIAFEAKVEIGVTEVLSGYNVPVLANEVRIVDVGARQVRVLWSASEDGLADSCSVAASPSAWSPDGRYLILTCHRGEETNQVSTLEIVDIIENSITRIEAATNDSLWWKRNTSWSPDGSAVEWENDAPLSGVEFHFYNFQTKRAQSIATEPSYNWTWSRWSLDESLLGLVRTTKEQGYLELYAWHDFSVTAEVGLPQNVEWLDLYWVSE